MVRPHQKGFTLIHVLIVITAMSAFGLIYVSSDKTFNEERAAALTVARTLALLDWLYSRRSQNHSNSGWADVCDDNDLLNNLVISENPIPGWRNSNGFGYAYRFNRSAATCNRRVIALYQYIPRKWSGYVQNYLESTIQLETQGNLEVDVDRGFSLPSRSGLVVLATTLDLYGNLQGGVSFVRKEFQSTNLRRSTDIEQGATVASIAKPECSGGIPRVHYRVSGVCSYYPLGGDPYNVADLIDDSSDVFNYEADYYRTIGFEYGLANHCTDVNCDRSQDWEIRLYSKERIPDVGQTTDGDGNIVNIRLEPIHVVDSPSVDQCTGGIGGGSGGNGRDMKNLEALIEHLGFTVAGIPIVADVLNYLDIDYERTGNFITGYTFTIGGEEYRRQRLLNMSLERFEDIFSVDLVDFVDSSYLDISLRVDAWVSCAAPT